MPATEKEAGGWEAPASLYLHIPFCPYKCPYCDFVTHVGSPSLVEPYVEALCCEVNRIRASHSIRPLQTVYLGGGTPGMLSGPSIEKILRCAGDTFGFADSVEITIETNPDTATLEQLAAFQKAGVTRLSIGAQSLIDGELTLLGRGHDRRQVKETVQRARQVGFKDVSLDLIYGIPAQTMNSWIKSLDRVLELESEHVSLYSLIVEPGTAFERRQNQRKLSLPEDDLVADMYEVACERLRSAGLTHYEVANWAKPGYEARHNQTYWKNQEFFAAGVGAHDYLRPYRSVRIRSVKRYVDAIARGDSVIADRTKTTEPIERFETAVMNLRLLGAGIDRTAFKSRFAEGLDATYGSVIHELVDLQFLTDDGSKVRLREEKVPLANEAWERFLL